jgi:hypothetical protein
MSMEAEVQALLRQLPEEGQQAVRVVGARRPEAHRRAVSQDDVGEGRRNG